MQPLRIVTDTLQPEGCRAGPVPDAEVLACDGGDSCPPDRTAGERQVGNSEKPRIQWRIIPTAPTRCVNYYGKDI